MEEKKIPKFRPFWLVYFLVMIALVGIPRVYVMSVPFLLCGFFFERSRKLGERFICGAVDCLMRLEPWFSGETRLKIPPGAISISNHRSSLDAFILLSRIPGVRMVCKKSLLRFPFLGVIMRLTRQIPIRRGDSRSYLLAMEEVRRGIRNGEAIHVFPEMTRCEPLFRGTLKFHLAPFHIAFQEKVPVVPLVFLGTDQAWPKGSYGLSFRHPVRVHSLEPLDPRTFPNSTALASEVQRRIDAYLLAEDYK